MLDNSILGEAQDFEIRAFSVDDDPDDLQGASDLLQQHGIEPKPWDTVKQFGSAILNSTERDILVSDIRIEGVSNLGDLGHEEIDTRQGTTVGLQLLTSYYDAEQLTAGLRILLTQHAITKDIKDTITRLQKAGENIHAFRKTNETDKRRLHDVLDEFVAKQKSDFISAKWDYVDSLVREWGLLNHERNILFGLYSSEDSYWSAIKSGTSARDVESRCDLIYRLKTNLVLVYGPDDLEQEQLWFRTPIPKLGNQSPLQYISDRYLSSLYDLVMFMEAP